MPNIRSNRIQKQKRQARQDNLMQGPGMRFRARIETKERTIERKIKRGLSE